MGIDIKPTPTPSIMLSQIKKLLPTWYTKLRQKYRAEKHKKT